MKGVYVANVEFSNYEIHKQLYAAMAKPSKETLKERYVSIGAWFSASPACDYYMLMCKENSYYTVFHFNNMHYNKGMEEVQKTLESRGEVIDISYSQENDAYECWVKEKDTEEIHMYYFFKYDWGVIEVE